VRHPPPDPSSDPVSLTLSATSVRQRSVQSIHIFSRKEARGLLPHLGVLVSHCALSRTSQPDRFAQRLSAAAVLSAVLHGNISGGLRCGEDDSLGHCPLVNAVEALNWVNFALYTVASLGLTCVGFTYSWPTYHPERDPSMARIERGRPLTGWEQAEMRARSAPVVIGPEAGRLGPKMGW
jgi:hypothetical protein